MKILFIGDIVGRPGRDAVKKLIPDLKKEFGPDIIIANGENVSGGKGLSAEHAHELKKAGIDFFTTGNHIWKQSSIFSVMDQKDTFVIRPGNYPDSNPGRGYQIYETDMMKRVLIINLQGRVFVKEDTDCPFRALDRILQETAHEKLEAIFLDFHAEATSEKICLGLYAAERGVTAMVGTHTHIPTADERILKGTMAYISDVGYVGLKDSAIGVDPEPIIKHFLTQMPVKHTITPGGPVEFNSVIIELINGKATSIQRIQRTI